MSQLTLDSIKPHNDNCIERKAINVSGRLGSFYDASYDKLIKQPSAEILRIQAPIKSSICRIFSGDPSFDLINYLKWMDFNDAHRQSIILGMVTPSGVSSVICYNQPVNENTRFLYYSYRSREEHLDVIAGKLDHIIEAPSTSICATHLITKILWGFEVLCIIPISDNQSTYRVDSLLSKISTRLENTEQDFYLTDDEKRQVTLLTNVILYGSETCVDTPNTSLLAFLTKLAVWQNNENFHHPLKYTMHSLRCLYNNDQFSDFYDLPNQNNPDIAKIQPTFIQIDKWIKELERLFETIPKTSPSPAFIQQQFCSLLDTYQKFREHLHKTVADVRRHCCEPVAIGEVILDQRYSSLRPTELKMLYENVHRWFIKAMLIERLTNDQIQYMNTVDTPFCRNILTTVADIDAELKRSLTKKDTSIILWYSSDRLKIEKVDKWEEIYEQLILERDRRTPQTSLIYVDFSKCQGKLEDFTIVRLPEQSSSIPLRDHPREKPLPSGSSPKLQRPLRTSSPPSQRPSPPATEINVLLLGETGVGKSTFINAFVNYLAFNTLQQAQRDEPIVLIPVSFLITIGDQFKEFTVKFGDADTNENHEHPGESVTQQCKSYVFDLNDTLRLRLIDTSGMGDTRGVDQDVKNIAHILTYVNNLSHLNAVCLLLKPNASRLNVFFRSCINQLLTYLTPIGYDNIIFCFTNARSTFFAPGNTGPLLRQMLKQEHLDDIPFQKSNTFCFDSESFRYLAAKKRGVNFDQFQNEECIKSWTTSITECVRLLNFIQTRKPYNLDEWQSPRKIAIEISMLARPLMETLRLILYNWKLRETGVVDKEMTLNPNPVTTEICFNCAQSSIVQVGSFFIVEYGSTQNSSIKQCSCLVNERHFMIESTVQHIFVVKQMDLSTEELQNSFHNFLFKCDILTYFLRQKGLSNQDDPFTPVLKQFLEEEQQISENAKSNLNMNKRVKEMLRSIRQMRHKNMQQLIKSSQTLSLSEMYQIINELKSNRAVNQQIESIKTSRQLIMEANEHQVKIPSIKNKIFAELTNPPQ